MRWTPSGLRSFLHERGVRLRRSLGQSFLADENFLEALARDTGAGRGDAVVEIGSGPGNLTERLAARAGRVWAFEIDRKLYDIARGVLDRATNVTLLNADGAGFDAQVDPEGRPVRVVSNLPYSDWKRLLLRLLSTPLDIVSYTLMLQEDVYSRLRAKPGTKDYGPMPALLQATCEIRKIRRAGRGLFFPRPRVDSVVFELVRRERIDFAAAESGLRKLFAHRRKKSEAAGGRRVEELAPADLLALTRP